MSNVHRPSLRLGEYAYSQSGAYFVTFGVQHRACLLGNVEHDVMHPNASGHAALNRWDGLEGRFNDLEVDAVVVMPNHLHGIRLLNVDTADLVDTTYRDSLGTCMQCFKSTTTHDYMTGVTSDGWAPFEGRLWHRNCYEHMVRNDRDLDRIRTYIDANLSRWASDDENPKRIRDAR